MRNPLILILLASAVSAPAAPLRVCATTPDAGDLLRVVGGDQVEVTVFCKGPEDPHFVVAKPGFVKRLSEADLFVQVGAELEVGYVPVLLEGSRNGKLKAGLDGFLDLSDGIELVNIPTGPVDRSMGDVHAGGNPHFLLDPVNGLRAAEAIEKRLTRLRPEAAESFQARLKAFQTRLGAALVGPELAGRLNPVEVAEAVRLGTLPSLLEARGVTGALGGWLADLLPYAGTPLAGDHNMYPYLVRRFGLKMDVFLEPKPGVSPSTRHLKTVVDRVKAENIRALVVGPYFDEKPVAFVSATTGVCVARLAHQTQGLAAATDYQSMCETNAMALLHCLKSGK